MNSQRTRAPWRDRLNRVIFEAESPSGKAFDVALIFTIVASLVVVMLDSVKPINEKYGSYLRFLEWTFTLLFTLEYVLRLICVQRPARYARSFFGVVDLLAILPTYVSFFVPGAQTLLVVRTFRILRIFRIFELGSYVQESEQLVHALKASKRKIQVFVFTVLILVVIFGSLMYLIEGAESGFTSIPRGVYWAIVTMTTVGYGDIAPESNFGQAVAAFIMILGYGIIAVPTGIVSAELTLSDRRRAAARSSAACPACGASDHAGDAEFCRCCGERIASGDSARG